MIPRSSSNSRTNNGKRTRTTSLLCCAAGLIVVCAVGGFLILAMRVNQNSSSNDPVGGFLILAMHVNQNSSSNDPLASHTPNSDAVAVSTLRGGGGAPVTTTLGGGGEEPTTSSSSTTTTTTTKSSSSSGSIQKPAAAHVIPPPEFCRTSSTGFEILLESLVGSILREDGFLPAEGSILDVGAQFGEQACSYARVAPDRVVHALDPSLALTQAITAKFAAALPNLRVQNAGIGQFVTRLKVDHGRFTGMKLGDEFDVETLDHLFFDQGEKLAFAHIDVEGRELDALKGGVKTIAANEPVFTTEVRVHENETYTKALLSYINELGYDSYVVDEPCGYPHMDYRNLISVPRSRPSALIYSDVFNLAWTSEAIFRVNAETIGSKVYPCCALGGECCPYNSTDHPKCCGQDFMKKWHQQNNVKKPIAMQGFTYSKRHVRATWRNLAARSQYTPEAAAKA